MSFRERSSEVIFPPGRAWSVPEAEHQLRLDRKMLPRSEREKLVGEIDRLWQGFSVLSRNWQQIIRDERLRQEALRKLSRRGSDALAITRLVYAELEAINTGSRPVASPALIAELIQFNAAFLTMLQAQLRLLSEIDDYADSLLLVIEELFHSRRVSPARLRNLAEQILSDQREAAGTIDPPDCRRLFTVPEISLADYLKRDQRQAEGWACAVGIQSARLIARILPDEPPWSGRIELLMMAALLQDVGFLCLEEEHLMSPGNLREERPDLFRRHPAISAGMAAALGAFPCELPFLVGAHHERLDRSGYPRRLGSPELTPGARLLGIVGRLVDIVVCPAQTRDEPDFAHSVFGLVRSAAVQIRRDSACGRFDRDLVNLLFSALGTQPLELDEMQDVDLDPQEFSPFAERRWRVDQEHRIVAEKPESGKREQTADAAAPAAPKMTSWNWRREVARFSEF